MNKTHTLRWHAYLWGMMAVLLLAAAFTTPQLDADAFSGDELRTVLAAGGAHHGPLSFPMGVIRNTNMRSPDQALGFPLVARLWGDYAGWTEYPLRVFTLLTGVLVLALVYRAGADLFSPFAGFSAAVVMATSIYYISYMHKFRVFTLVCMSVVLALWCYWRLVLAPKPPGWVPAVGLVIAGVGLTYTHYFATPLLGALGLFHLLFARPFNRRWWYPVGLFGVVMLIFLPQLNFLIDGVIHNSVRRPELREEALNPFGVIERLVFFFGNGFHLLFVAYVGLGAVAFLRAPRRSAIQFNLWLLWFCAVLLLLGIIGMNEFAGVMPPRRVRYLMPMWVPLSLLVGVGIWKLTALNRWAPGAVLALWAVVGIAVNVDNTLMIFPRGDNAPVPAWREVMAPVFAEGEPGDTYYYIGEIEPRAGHYSHGIDNRHFIQSYYTEEEIRAAMAGSKRLWFTINHLWSLNGNLTLTYELFDEYGYDYCATYWHDDIFTMRLYVSSPAFCPGGEPMLTFGEQITLMQLEEVRDDDTLTLNTGWALSPQMPTYTYSIGFHIYDDSNTLIAQQDVGLGAHDGPYTPVQAAFDVSDLPEGEYEVRVVVYDWNTGERLMGTHADDTSITRDILLLERFVVTDGAA